MNAYKHPEQTSTLVSVSKKKTGVVLGSRCKTKQVIVKTKLDNGKWISQTKHIPTV